MHRDELLRAIYSKIDGEANEQETGALRKECEESPEAAHVAEKAEQFDDALRSAVKRAYGNDTASSNLRDSIFAELDKIDEEEALQQPAVAEATVVTPVMKIARGFAIAASMFLLIGAGFLGSHLYQYYLESAPLQLAHWEAASNVDNFDAQLTSMALTNVADNYAMTLSNMVGGFELSGGSIESIGGVDMTHFVFSNNEKVVSVFIAPAGEFSIPDELIGQPVVRGDRTLFDHHCRGCRLVYQRTGDIVIITATTDREMELLDFNPLGSI